MQGGASICTGSRFQSSWLARIFMDWGLHHFLKACGVSLHARKQEENQRRIFLAKAASADLGSLRAIWPRKGPNVKSFASRITPYFTPVLEYTCSCQNIHDFAVLLDALGLLVARGF